MAYHFGIDLGGTNIAVGVVSSEHQIIGKASIPTGVPDTAEHIADRMAMAARMAAEDAGISLDEIETVGIGSPGSVDPHKGIVQNAFNLGFVGVPLRQLLGERLHKPVYLENDANAAAYGEVMAGAAKGYRNVVVITLGTGVGGGILVDGRLITGVSYCGGELGHMGMVYDGEPCTCGRRGCVEAYCSATALIRQTKRKMLEHRESLMWQLCGGDIDKVNGRTSFDAMRQKDAAAVQVVEQYISYLGFAVCSIINLLQPEILLIGGGISKEGDVLLNPIREIMRRETFCKEPERNTILAAATLGNSAGIIGAAALHQLYEVEEK